MVFKRVYKKVILVTKWGL